MDNTHAARERHRRWITLVGIALLLAIAGLLLGRSTTSQAPPIPSESSAQE